MRIEYFALTDVGRVRAENQDSYGFSESANLYFVCDGMGGGAAGDFASRCAAQVITHAFANLTGKDMMKISGSFVESATEYAMRPVAAIRLSNRVLHSLADKYSKLTGMGTTAVAILIEKETGTGHIYHVGDSRLYRLRDGALELLTKDHSKINELLDEGKMQLEEINTAEIQSMITRAVGTGSTVKVDYLKIAVRPDDCFMLCSDGLNGEIDDAAIARIMSGNVTSLEHMAHGLIDAANSAGGKDNTTVLVVRALGRADDAPAGQRSGGGEHYTDVVTIPDETPGQLAYENTLVKDIISAARIKVPKSALDTSLLSSPLLLAVVFLVVLLGLGYVFSHVSKKAPDTALVDLSGTVNGVQLFVRAPTAAQQALFKNASSDTIAKLQLIQDWMREPNLMTEPLKSVQLVVVSNGKEAFNGLSNPDGNAIRVPRGLYWLTLRYPGYSIITEKAERKDTIPLVVESATALKPMTVIMLPAD